MARAVRLQHLALASQGIEQQAFLIGCHGGGQAHPQHTDQACQAGDFFRIIHGFYSTLFQLLRCQKMMAAWYRPHMGMIASFSRPAAQTGIICASLFS
jgi:hypothetical protein